MAQLWAFFSTHATAFGVIVSLLVAVGGGAKWLISRRKETDPPLRGRLPPAPIAFTGRIADVRRIEQALNSRGAVISALHGMGGVGKTATALYVAQRLAARRRFKDAQLFIDLQGYTPGKAPLSPEEALKELLWGAFVPRDKPLPDSLDQLKTEWQARTRGLRMLLVLDNTRNEDQFRPLLPNHPTCTVLVTSRERFGLPGIATIPLDEMTPADAADLAQRLANTREHRRLNRRQAEALAQACGRLPLAIELAAGNLGASRTLIPEELIGSIFSYLQRGERSVRAVLLVSLDALSPKTRARWAALGVFEGGFDVKAAAAVWTVEEAGGTLDELEQRSLVSFDTETQRYHLHDLLRAVALEELARDPAREHDAVARHAGHFFVVLQAADHLYNAGHDDVGRGLALLDTELANIRAAQRWAAGAMAGDERAAGLAQDFPNHVCLTLRLAPDEHLAWLETSLAAAEQRGDREAQAVVAGNLGLIYRIRGDLDRAKEMHHKSLAIAQELGQKEVMANQYGNLGLIYRGRGELDRAEEMHHKSLAIEQELGRKEGMARQYGNLGIVYMDKRELDRAEEMYRRSLEISEAIGHKELNANQYGNLGNLYAQRGEMGQAVAYWRRSLALYREIGARPQIEQVSGLLREAGVDPDRGEAAA